MRIDTETRPNCPHCSTLSLERRPARFATPKGETQGDLDDFDAMDEERIGGIMESMMGELGDAGSEEDPRRIASLFRRFGEEAGMEVGPQMADILGRMEAGEDPEQLENDMDTVFPEDGSMQDVFRFKKALREIRQRRPNVDERLYYL